MFYYLIGLGSNIQPDKHLSKSILLLATQVSIISQSPVLINPPCGDSFQFEFHNQLLLIHSQLDADCLKEKLEHIELQLGREAKSPARKLKDRTIDIDIIKNAETIHELFKDPLEESYNRDIMNIWPEIKIN